MNLADRVLVAVESKPGANTNKVVSLVAARKGDVIAKLERLHEDGLLSFEPGPRASKSWHVLASPRNQFPLPSGTFRTGPGTESRAAKTAEGGGRP